MGVVRSGLQRAARRMAEAVARQVARDDLFEKRGERAPTEPLPPRVQVSPAPKAAAGPAPKAAAGPAPKAAAGPAPKAAAGPAPALGLPAAGCVRADLDLVAAAHGPGPRPRVVNHWATWCVPCVDELPLLVKLAADLGQAADFLGVSWDLFDPRGDEEDIVDHVARFADGNGVPWPSLLVTAAPQAFFQRLGIQVEKIPQTWVIAADGQVLARYDGAVDAGRCAEISLLLRGA